MKQALKFFLFCLLFSSSLISFSQINLVPNPSFELYDTCPNFLSQIHRSTNFYPTLNTPDYFNSCAPISFPSVSVPYNYFGYRSPASGNAYAGIIAKMSGSVYSEHIGVELLTPLQVGFKYFISFKVSLAGQANPTNYCGINKLGVLFSSTQYDISNPSPICNCAQVYSDSIITDTLMWTRLKGSFTADSSYSYMHLGKFFSATDSIQINGTGCSAYYYIDDICVSTDSVFSYNYIYTSLNDIIVNEKAISIFPNPFTNFVILKDKEAIDKIIISNALGQIIKTCEIKCSDQYELDLSDLSKGMYIFTIYKKDNNIISQTLIKL